MLVKVQRTNIKGELKETLINTDYIVCIKELSLEPVELYDGNGDVVETREQPKAFQVILRTGVDFRINETEYTNLIKTLLK